MHGHFRRCQSLPRYLDSSCLRASRGRTHHPQEGRHGADTGSSAIDGGDGLGGCDGYQLQQLQSSGLLDRQFGRIRGLTGSRRQPSQEAPKHGATYGTAALHSDRSRILRALWTACHRSGRLRRAGSQNRARRVADAPRRHLDALRTAGSRVAGARLEDPRLVRRLDGTHRPFDRGGDAGRRRYRIQVRRRCPNTIRGEWKTLAARWIGQVHHRLSA